MRSLRIPESDDLVSVDRARGLHRAADGVRRRLDAAATASSASIVDPPTARLLSDAVCALEVVLDGVGALPEPYAPTADDLTDERLTLVEASAVERIERARSLGHEPSQLWMTLASVAGELRRRRA